MTRQYMISLTADEKIYRDVCRQLEESIEGLKKEEESVDFLDGDRLQRYWVGSQKIDVRNEYSWFDAVYIRSNMDLGYLDFMKDKKMRIIDDKEI